MILQIEEFMTWFSLISALLGLLISIYNWILMHKAADIRPQGILELGITEVNGGYILEVPIIVSNEGFQPGMITWVEISVEGSKGKNLLNFGRRVKLNVGNTPPKFLHQKHFQDLVPAYPISVPPQQSATIMLEFYDYKKNPVLIFDEKMTCEITVYSDSDKKRTKAFPIQINAELFAQKPYLVWVPTSGDSGHAKHFLMDSNDSV